jgi:hypothetical protein
MASVIPRQFPTQKMLPLLLLALNPDNLCSNADFIRFRPSERLHQFLTGPWKLVHDHVESDLQSLCQLSIFRISAASLWSINHRQSS